MSTFATGKHTRGVVDNVVGVCFALLSRIFLKADRLISIGLSRLTRVLGSYAAIVGEFLKAGFWPQQWGWYDNALMRWCTGMAVTMDILYACIFWYMGQAEEAAKGRKA